ncbi:MAG: ATP-grasp domain-containing protein [Patescibacteria group bacterium]|nr:ATP-grasp domain-containing protein [Patescibacteria group bacterium]
MSLATKVRVGVLRGGPSSEHEVSVKSGANVLKNMPDGYYPVDIFLDRAGGWYVNGVAEKPEKVFRRVDVVFNTLHGKFGEDGTVSRLLDSFGVPHTGSKHLASAISMHKGHAKNLLKKRGIKSPYHKIVSKAGADTAAVFELWRTLPNPSIVKPMNSGSSIGVSVAENFAEFQIALEKAFAESDAALVEEFLFGREATCGVIDDFRRQEVYALLPAELSAPAGSRFLDYGGKYGGAIEACHPGRFSVAEKDALQAMARAAHEALGLRHYSRSDFIVTQKRGIYFLETNSLPGLYADAPFCQSLSAVGSSLPEFIGHILKLALNGK